MQQSDHHWLNDTRAGRVILFVFFIVVVLCFTAACFVILYVFTNWPIWLQIIAALSGGLVLFLSWAKAHATNGFDGNVYDQQRKDANDPNRGGPSAA